MENRCRHIVHSVHPVLWVKNDIASTLVTMPKEQAIPLVVTTIVVSAVKVAVIAGVILLAKWVIGKIKSK